MSGHRGRQVRVVGRRPVKHTVKVTAEQESKLRAAAAEQGVTVARLMVETTLAGDGWTPTQRRALVRELSAMRRDLEGVGVNVNQMARWSNREQRFPRDAARLLGVVERAALRLEALVAELRSA